MGEVKRRFVVIAALLAFLCSTCPTHALDDTVRIEKDPVIEACSNYTILTSKNRSVSFKDPDVQLCDNNLTVGWYRFSVQAGGQMRNECVPNFSCGTFAPGWLEGNQPTVLEGEVQRRVCFNLDGDCCENAVLIRAKNCGSFYVYRLDAPSYCPFRYCGEKTNTSSEVKEYNFDACSNYSLLLSEDRSVSAKGKKRNKCDDSMAAGWYRFSNAAGGKMYSQCPTDSDCGTSAPGWLKGNHPSINDGEVHRNVCFSLNGNCCNRSEKILVKNCGDFYVYRLNGTNFCPSRYCGGNLTSLPISEGSHVQEECIKHSVLKSHDRAMNYYNPYVSKSDVTLVPGWYRIKGDAGKQIPEKPVPLFHCGTHAPGWMNGTHPTLEQGVVARQICFHWRKHICKFQTKIWVHKCEKFIVYNLQALEINYSRYCGDGTKPDPYFQPHPGTLTH